jgi:hypothetical protein
MKTRSSSTKTDVLVLGLIHATDMKSYLKRSYLQNLETLILQLRPMCICVELSPEQLAGSVPARSKPEYHRVILPAAEKCGSRVEPIQPSTKRGLQLELEKNRIMAEALKSEATRSFLDFGNSLGGILLRRVHRIVAESDGIARLQQADIHGLIFAALEELDRKHLPKAVIGLWKKWNRDMAAQIVQVAAANRRGLLLVTVGLQHVMPLRALLSRRESIRVCELSEFLGRPPLKA